MVATYLLKLNFVVVAEAQEAQTKGEGWPELKKAPEPKKAHSQERSLEWERAKERLKIVKTVIIKFQDTYWTQVHHSAKLI